MEVNIYNNKLQELLDHSDLLDHRVKEDHQDLLVKWVLQEKGDSLVNQVFQDHKETQAYQEQME